MKIKLSNKSEISATLDKVNGKAFRHTIHRVNDLEMVLNRAIKQMDEDKIPMKDRSGATVTYRPASPYSNSKYSCITTQVTLQLGADGRTAYLIDARRAETYQSKEFFDVALKAGSVMNFVARAESKYGQIAA